MKKSLFVVLLLTSAFAWADEAKISSASMPDGVKLGPAPVEYGKKKTDDAYLGFKPETDPNKLPVDGQAV